MSEQQHENKNFFTIQRLTVEDTAEVIEFLNKYHYPNEPCNKALGITKSDEEDKWKTACLKHGFSYKAVNEAGEMIALKLNGFTNRGEKFDIPTGDPKFGLGMRFVKFTLSEFDVFSFVEPDIDRIVECQSIVVRPDYQKRGLAKALYKKTTEWMVENGFKYMVIHCSSVYTIRACERLGFKEVFSMKFTDFKENGVSPMVPEEPHTTFKRFLTTVEI